MEKHTIAKGYLTSYETVIAMSDAQREEKWQQQFNKSFGATLAYNFDDYKYLTFNFYDVDQDKYFERTGFADIDDFITFMNNNYVSGGFYKTVTLHLYLKMSDKIQTPTFTAQNTKQTILSLFHYRDNSGDKQRQNSHYVEGQINDGDWFDSAIQPMLAEMWQDMFGEDISGVLNANPDFKKCMWVAKRRTNYGLPKIGQVIDAENNNGDRHLYNLTDSNIGAGTVVTTQANTLLAGAGTTASLGSNGNNPMWYMIEAGANNWGINNKGEFGLYPTNSMLLGTNYSMLAVYGIRKDIGGKTYRAIYITPPSIDSIKMDMIDFSKYRAFAVKKVNGKTVNIKHLNINFEDGWKTNRVGRSSVDMWSLRDYDHTSNSPYGSPAESIHFFYQEIESGECSRFSKSHIKAVATQFIKNGCYIKA